MIKFAYKTSIIDNKNYHIEIKRTGDGSYTLKIPELNESYHSMHGARTESMHVFIEKGLNEYIKKHRSTGIIVSETGFGTGLNALLTLEFAGKNHISVLYETYEKYPLADEIIDELKTILDPSEQMAFEAIHKAAWESAIEITPYFSIIKHKDDIARLNKTDAWDVHFFDAFSPRVQPGLWTKEVLERIYNALKPGGYFVTYSSKGSVRRLLQDIGFDTEKLPGPPGKREMLRAIKPV
jgi:tRNA U34 5-methylaminomethyl-2-thiouridine-forming methyltransferase MnmC